MNGNSRSPRRSARSYVARNVYDEFFQHVMELSTGDLESEQMMLWWWMAKHYRLTEPMFDREEGLCLDIIKERINREAPELVRLLKEAEAITRERIPKDLRGRFVLVPRQALGILFAWPLAAFHDVSELGQTEANRLEQGHRRRSRTKDPVRTVLLEWVHARRTVEEESWKETMVALEQECSRRGVENPWRKKQVKLQKDLSEHLRERGLGRGKPGRPKKVKPK